MKREAGFYGHRDGEKCIVQTRWADPLLMIQHDTELDAKGLNCPLPLLRLKKTLQTMESGQVVRVLATDPAAHLDFGVFSEKTGNRIVDSYVQDGIQIFLIQKK